MLRIVPDVPMTRSNPTAVICSQCRSISAAIGFDQLALVALRQRVALDEALRQADDADLEAARELDRRRRAERDLDAAAADIDDHRAAAADVDAVDGRLVDEPRFFRPGDDARLDAGVLLDSREELAAVARFAHGARGGGENLIHAVRLGKAFELGQRLERRASSPRP